MGLGRVCQRYSGDSKGNMQGPCRHRRHAWVDRGQLTAGNVRCLCSELCLDNMEPAGECRGWLECRRMCLQAGHALSEVLGMTSGSNFGFFCSLKCLHPLKNICMHLARLKSEYKTHLCFKSALNTLPEGNFCTNFFSNARNLKC